MEVFVIQGLRALHEQFDMNYQYFVPSTLYGSNFDHSDSHFIFDLIKKIVAGKEGHEPVVLWGDVACATERNPLKIGRMMPGCRIPIVDKDDVDPPDACPVLPWNFLGEFPVKKRDYILDGGVFLVPLPEPHLITRDNYANRAKALVQPGVAL